MFWLVWLFTYLLTGYRLPTRIGPSVSGPRAELEIAGLYVEGEVGDVDLAGGHEQCGRDPQHRAVVLDHTHCLPALFQSSVRTAVVHKHTGPDSGGGQSGQLPRASTKTVKNITQGNIKILFWSVNCIGICIHYTRFMMI